MKRLVVLCLVLFVAGLILLPRPNASKLSKPNVADGYRLPSFPPGGGSTLVADRYALPPFPPSGGFTLIANG